MTTTYDPTHPRYTDEADVRGELTRVFDVCHGCRACVDLCTVFPTLFDLVDGTDGAGDLTPAEQDAVVGACYQCKLCALGCPYTPDRHELAVDVPRLMLRATAMRRRNGHLSMRQTTADRVLGRTDRLGSMASRTAPLANRIVSAEAGSFVRTLTAKLTGVSAVRLLPPYARQRFSTWFDRRARSATRDDTRGEGRATVTVYPTCVVEYQAPEIGHDLVKVYERNGIDCRRSSAGCCGAPLLHSGDVDRFAAVAREVVATLAAEVRAGTQVVVPQPTCSFVLRHDYADHVGGPDADLVAANTFDAAEYLMRRHADGDLDTTFTGEVPAAVTYHEPCHLRAQDLGLPAHELLRLTGATVDVVRQCAGIDGTWGLRAENEAIAIPVAAALGDRITRSDGDVVSGDCHLANTAITEQTGATPLHPLQVVARAYGIAAEPSRRS